VNRLVKSLLRTGMFLLDQSDQATADVRDRFRDGIDEISDRTRRVMRSQQSHFMRDALTFAAGVTVGIGVGMLFAPASGEETRNTIADKAQDVSNKVRDRFAAESERAAS
jgi:hypothetical protein